MAGLAGPDAEPGGQVGLARARRAEEHHVLLALDEVQGAEVGDHVALERALVVEVEVLQGLASGEASGAYAVLSAVVLA